MSHKPALDNIDLPRLLNALYKDFDFNARTAHDPISIPMKYSTAADIEVSGFIAAAYAYGRVDLFLPVLKRIMEKMGTNPHMFIMNFSIPRHGKLFKDISYRFNKPDDLIGLIYALRRVLKKHGTLEDLYLSHSTPDDTDIGAGLAGMMGELKQAGFSGAFRGQRSPAGYAHYFPSPGTGGAAKRGALFMRWMVRKRDIDFGIWSRVSPSTLVIPLDTHIARICRCLGLTGRKSNDWKTALEITGRLRKMDAADPIRFDFALCHRGIAGLCATGACKSCKLNSLAK